MAGRPFQFESPEQMQAVIDNYFETEPRPTVTGLAIALDLTRQGLINYQGRPEFAHVVTLAKTRVEEVVERRLMYESGGAAGPIFNLKNNFGWKDERHLDQNVKAEIKEWNILPVRPSGNTGS